MGRASESRTSQVAGVSQWNLDNPQSSGCYPIGFPGCGDALDTCPDPSAPRDWQCVSSEGRGCSAGHNFGGSMHGADSSEAESEATRQENTFGHSYYAHRHLSDRREWKPRAARYLWAVDQRVRRRGWRLVGSLRFNRGRQLLCRQDGAHQVPSVHVHDGRCDTHGYSPFSDTGGGWGFYERMIPCDYLSRITLTNQMVFPPMLPFDYRSTTTRTSTRPTEASTWAWVR